jgi:excisionase family DNA binding protein
MTNERHEAPPPRAIDPEPLLTARQVAEMLGVSAATVLDRFERGDLPGFRLWGRRGGPVRFRQAEIDALLESWRP